MGAKPQLLPNFYFKKSPGINQHTFETVCVIFIVDMPDEIVFSQEFVRWMFEVGERGRVASNAGRQHCLAWTEIKNTI